MAGAPRSIFNQRATERLRSPDDLDKYVQVTNPSVWTLLIANVALVLGLLCWGIFGSVTTSVSTISVRVDDTVLCFLDAEGVASVKVGNGANVGGRLMKVAEVANIPYSRKEARKLLGNDYLVNALVTDDWEYLVTFEDDTWTKKDVELPANTPLQTTITTERMAPLSLVFGSKS